MSIHFNAYLPNLLLACLKLPASFHPPSLVCLQVASLPVEEGDFVIVASDGLFDNVFDEDIVSVVKVFGGRTIVDLQRTGELSS